MVVRKVRRMERKEIYIFISGHWWYQGWQGTYLAFRRQDVSNLLPLTIQLDVDRLHFSKPKSNRKFFFLIRWHFSLRCCRPVDQFWCRLRSTKVDTEANRRCLTEWNSLKERFTSLVYFRHSCSSLFLDRSSDLLLHLLRQPFCACSGLCINLWRRVSTSFRCRVRASLSHNL